jgi:hypothetical protein
MIGLIADFSIKAKTATSNAMPDPEPDAQMQLTVAQVIETVLGEMRMAYTSRRCYYLRLLEDLWLMVYILVWASPLDDKSPYPHGICT